MMQCTDNDKAAIRWQVMSANFYRLARLSINNYKNVVVHYQVSAAQCASNARQCMGVE